MASLKASICIPIYNNANNFKNLYYSITSNCPNYGKEIEFIIYNDGSTVEGIHEEVEEFCSPKGIRYINNATNKGVAHAWNRLTEAANSEIIILLNDDVRACTKSWIDHISSTFENNERVGIVYWCQKQINSLTGVSTGYTKDSLNLLLKEKQHPYLRNCFCGAFFSFRKSVWRQISQPDKSTGFWEDLLSYGEEIDFSSEFLNLGYSIIQLPTITFEHFRSQTFTINPEKKFRKNLSRYLSVEEFHQTLLKFSHCFELSSRELLLLKIGFSGRSVSVIRRIPRIREYKIYKIPRLDYSMAMLLKKWKDKKILGFNGEEYLNEIYLTGYPSALKDAIQKNKFNPPEKIYFMNTDASIKILSSEECIDNSLESFL